jgi:hypothetical protein
MLKDLDLTGGHVPRATALARIFLDGALPLYTLMREGAPTRSIFITGRGRVASRRGRLEFTVYAFRMSLNRHDRWRFSCIDNLRRNTLMSRHIGTIGVLALGCAIAVQAQAPSGREASRTSPGEITITGCVERADQVSAAVTAGTTVDSLSFVLIKATRGTGADARAAGTSGTQASTEKDSMYRLDAEVSKLNAHVGHKVEVTGTLVGAIDSTTKSADPSASAPRLKVDRVKMLSETCGR